MAEKYKFIIIVWFNVYMLMFSLNFITPNTDIITSAYKVID